MQQTMLQQVHEALTIGREYLEEKHLAHLSLGFDFTDYALKAFTDNIVIGWPVRDDAESEFGRAFDKLATFQLQMVTRGYFLRGGISVGDAYIDEMAVFGPAFLEAYRAEATVARDPRIVITPSAVELVRKHLGYYASRRNAPQVRHLLCDSDGQWFLNYLDCVLLAEDESGPFYDIFLEHKSAVEAKLDKFKTAPPIWAKYAWAARYHNHFCDLHSHYFGADDRIDVSLYQKGLTSIIAEEGRVS